VGGTRLSVREDGSYFSEDGWEDTLSSDGTGGGVSPLDRRPDWQRGEGLGFSSRRRLVPDVAGPADCDSAYFIVYPEVGGNGSTRVQGPHGCGTSAAAPFWAGVTALVQQYARERGVPRLGFLAPTLYEVARTEQGRAAFNDVQSGGNLKHNAGRGWDFATGLGSPNVWNLAQAVLAHLRESSTGG
jgi:kumamolisin